MYIYSPRSSERKVPAKTRYKCPCVDLTLKYKDTSSGGNIALVSKVTFGRYYEINTLE